MTHPKCIHCGKPATRWDGGMCGAVIKNGQLQAGPVMWLCDEHDPYHQSFDLPTTLPDAIAEIVVLREELQKVFARTLK